MIPSHSEGVPMKPSEMREELMQQHADIRAQIADVRRDLAASVSDGARTGDDLRAALRLLADNVRAHNAREEELLHDYLPSVDAWGPVRTEIMLKEHAKEHEELYAALVGATTAEDGRRLLAGLVTQMLEHMAHEEKIFLGENILSDGAVVGDYFGG